MAFPTPLSSSTVTFKTWRENHNDIISELIKHGAKTSTADPTVNDDTTNGYTIFSLWINSTTDRIWVCLDNTDTSAIWKEIANYVPASVAITGGTIDDVAITGGTVSGLNTDLAIADGGTGSSTASAARTALGLEIGTDVLAYIKNISTTTDPTVTSDAAAGYSVNSQWTNTTTDDVFFCVDATNGAAVWKNTSLGGGAITTVKTANYTAAEEEVVPCDTNTTGSFTVTLPPNPLSGKNVEVIDYAGTFAVNSLTVGRNGKKIRGLAEDLVISTNNARVKFTYVDTTQGWLFGVI